MNAASLGLRAVWRLLPVLTDNRWVTAANGVITVGNVLLATVVPFFAKDLIASFGQSGAESTIAGVAWPAAILVVVLKLSGTFQAYTAAAEAIKVRSSVRQLLFEKLVHAPADTILDRPPTYWQLRMNRDVNRVMTFLPSALMPLLQTVLIALIYVGLLFYASWHLALVALFALPFTLLPQLWLNRLRAKERRISEEIGVASTTMISNTLGALPMVKLSTSESREVDRLDRRRRILVGLGLALERRRTIVRFVSRVSYSVLPVSLLVVGYLLFSEDVIAPADVGAFVICLAGITSGVGLVARRSESLPLALEAAQRVVEIFDMPDESATAPATSYTPGPRPDDGAVATPLGGAAPVQAEGADAFGLTIVPRRAWRPGQSIDSIALEDVHFSYRVRDTALEDQFLRDPGAFREVPILHGVDLELHTGESAALVGPSGAGKSTLVSLICGLNQPDAGRILINGTDLREVPIRDYRACISAVLHQDFLLSRPFSENVAYRDPAREGAEEVEQIVRDLGLETVRERDSETRRRWRDSKLADGFWGKVELPDDLIGEGPIQVSAGERQRIAIARQLADPSNVWVLDEATANLDGRSEERVFDRLGRIEPMLLLVVSHRLSCVRRAERIHVLVDGRRVDSGSHEQLMASNSTYRELFAPQIYQAAVGQESVGTERMVR